MVILDKKGLEELEIDQILYKPDIKNIVLEVKYLGVFQYGQALRHTFAVNKKEIILLRTNGGEAASTLQRHMLTLTKEDCFKAYRAMLLKTYIGSMGNLSTSLHAPIPKEHVEMIQEVYPSYKIQSAMSDMDFLDIPTANMTNTIHQQGTVVHHGTGELELEDPHFTPPPWDQP